MRRTLFFSLLAVALMIWPVSALAKNEPWTAFDTVMVKSYSADMIPDIFSTHAVLENGVRYKLVVTGTYDAGDGITADAQCSFRAGSSTEWTDTVSTYESYGETLLDLYAGGDHEWGPCSTSHTYSKIVVGDGSTLSFHIEDIYPTNNSGSLQVELYRFWDNPGKAGKGAICTPIQAGVLTYSAGHYLAGQPLQVGYNAYGYNYQGHIFSGYYANAYLGGDGFPPYQGDDEAYEAENPDVTGKWYWQWRHDWVAMKWNDAWLSNVDCDGDGSLDRHYGFDSYIGSGAWETNHMWGEYEIDDMMAKWNDFYKIVKHAYA